MVAVFLLGMAFGLSAMSFIETCYYAYRSGRRDVKVIGHLIVDILVITLTIQVLQFFNTGP